MANIIDAVFKLLAFTELLIRVFSIGCNAFFIYILKITSSLDINIKVLYSRLNKCILD